MAEKNFFEQLYDIDVRDRMYQKQGMSYVPWATAWSEVCKIFPNSTYEIKKFGENNLPYVASELGIMVFTTVTINGVTREMELPVMNGANKAMKFEPYEYTVTFKGKDTVKKVEAATMFDINKTVMRCLCKNIAMFGLGLHLWSKEEAPESVLEVEKLMPKIKDLVAKKCALSESAKKEVGELCKKATCDDVGNYLEIEDLDVLKELRKDLLKVMK